MFEEVIDYLNQERGVLLVPVSEFIYEGNVDILGQSFNMQIDLGKGFPKDFPVIRIINSTQFIPHSSYNGSLCLIDKDSVMIKPNMPNELLLDSFDRAVDILKMKPKEQLQEVFREFYSYWEQIARKDVLLYMNLPNAGIHEIREYSAIWQDKCLIVSSSEEESKALLANYMHCNFQNNDIHKIPCVRIKLRTSVIPPQMNSEITWGSIRRFIRNNITGSQKRKFDRLLSLELECIHFILILVIPSDFGDQYACLWLHYKKMNHKESIRNTTNCKIDAIPALRIDSKYMLTRGCAETSLENKAVLLIGCGSVGGFVAENLCQCGIGKLDILDKERITVDNVHRHVLGFSDAVTGGFKADLLKSRLEARFPYVEIDSLNYVDRTAETFISNPKRLKMYDLVVSATGNPTVDLELNDSLFPMEEAPSLVVCFNEPYGIGGHAIAVLKNGACLRCLYTDPISGGLVQFQGSFVEENQSFSKTFSGCAGSYVEYSVLDSQQTAIITTRLAIEVLKGQCGHTKLVSWVGKADNLKKAGFKTSEYYEKLIQSKSAYVEMDIEHSKRCKICGI